MPVAKQDVFIQAPMEKVWGFIGALENVAKCMPGYQRHEVINEQDSLWHLMGDVGIFKRPVTFLAHVERMEPETGTVAFQLTGRGENMQGHGTFKACPQGSGVAVLLELGLEGGGMKGTLVNAFLSMKLPEDLDTLAHRLKAVLEEA